MSFVGGLGGLLSGFFYPSFVYIAWILVLSVYLTLRPAAAAQAARPVPRRQHSGAIFWRAIQHGNVFAAEAAAGEFETLPLDYALALTRRGSVPVAGRART